MPTFISNTQTVGAIVYDLSGDPEVVVTQTGRIYGQNLGIGASAAQTANYRISVYGEVLADDAIEVFGSSSNTTTIFVGATGVLTGNGTSGTGIKGTGGSAVDIINNGEIHGPSTAVEWIIVNGTMNFSNHGTITSVTADAVELALTGRGSNYGTIVSLQEDGIDIFRSDDFTSPVIFANYGVISGNTYAINGDSGNPDWISNFGTLNGGLLLDGGDDRFINGGVVNGDAEMGSANDLYRAIGDGVVAGVVRGANGEDTLIGGALADNIDGGSDNDVLRGADGDDTILGGEGTDDIAGGSGDDSLDGGTDDDILRGNAGDDTIAGGIGDDTVLGGEGADQLNGDEDNDRVVGNNGDDQLFGNVGNDQLFGNNGDDALDGGTGNDTLRGGTENDILRGGWDSDNLFGDAGDDTLFGGLGRDNLFGGDGADSFVFLTGDSGVGGPLRDVVRDFEQGLDIIDLAQFAGVFDFAGTGPFSGGGQSSVRLLEVATGTIVQLDSTGDGVTNEEIFVSGVTGLTADDFVL